MSLHSPSSGPLHRALFFICTRLCVFLWCFVCIYTLWLKHYTWSDTTLILRLNMDPTTELDDAPTEIDSPSEGGNLDHVANLEDDIDQYGFLHREQELEQQQLRQRNRSRTPTRSEQIQRLRPLLDRHAASIPPCTSSSYRSIVADMNRQTVLLNTLPPDMAQLASQNDSTMYYNFIYSGMGKLQKIAMHLRCKYPGRHWSTYLQEVSGFGQFCNTVEEMQQKMYTCNSSFKWGATIDLVRRWWDLGLHKSYSHLYYLSLIHIWRCRRIERCRSRWSPYH